MSELVLKQEEKEFSPIYDRKSNGHLNNSSKYLSSVAVNLFKMGNIGPEIVYSEDIPSNSKSSDLLTKMGVFYITALGQGHDFHQGLFGPLPVPDNDTHFSFAFSFLISDSSNLDKRNRGKSFCILTLSFPKSLEKFFLTRKEIESGLDQYMQTFKRLEQIKRSHLQELKLFLVY